MKISESSWHYWLVSKYTKNPSQSLCIYFWQVVLYSLLTIFYSSAVYIFTFVFGFLVDTKYGIAPDTWVQYLVYPLLTLSSMLLFILVVCLASGIIILGYIGVSNCLERLKNKRSVNNKEDGIVLAFIKAKYKRICPQIEFVKKEKK